jgi:hypothetical protein
MRFTSVCGLARAQANRTRSRTHHSAFKADDLRCRLDRELLASARGERLSNPRPPQILCHCVKQPLIVYTFCDRASTKPETCFEQNRKQS